MTLYKWLQAAGSNANVDSNVNWAEGQAPSTVNDSARGMMAAIAKYRDDIAGAIVTGGTANAYTVTSYEGFDTLAHLSGQMIAFTPHVTNTAATIMSVDGLGGKPVRSAPNVEISAGCLVQGTPYIATYNNSDQVFYLHGFYGASPYLIPLGGMIDYTGTTAPNSNFVLPFGQAISRTTYGTYFAMVSTTFGTGDGSTTFNVPDLRGRVTAGKDDMGGAAASRLTGGGSGITGTTLGASGGVETKTLITANLPPYTPAGSVSTGIGLGGTLNTAFAINVPGSNIAVGGTATGGTGIALNGNIVASSTFTGAAQGGASTPITNAPPMIVLNKILRVI